MEDIVNQGVLLIYFAGYFLVNNNIKQDFLNYIDTVTKELEDIFRQQPRDKKMYKLYEDLNVLYYAIKKLNIPDTLKPDEEIKNRCVDKKYRELTEQMGYVLIEYGNSGDVKILNNYFEKLTNLHNSYENNKISRLYHIFEDFLKNINEKGTYYLLE